MTHCDPHHHYMIIDSQPIRRRNNPTSLPTGLALCPNFLSIFSVLYFIWALVLYFLIMITVYFHCYLTPPTRIEAPGGQVCAIHLEPPHSQEHCRHRSKCDEWGKQAWHRARAARVFSGTDAKTTDRGAQRATGNHSPPCASGALLQGPFLMRRGAQRVAAALLLTEHGVMSYVCLA